MLLLLLLGIIVAAAVFTPALLLRERTDKAAVSTNLNYVKPARYYYYTTLLLPQLLIQLLCGDVPARRWQQLVVGRYPSPWMEGKVIVTSQPISLWSSRPCGVVDEFPG